MKKYLSILFATFYLGISLGIAINGHFCKGYLISINIFGEEAPSCCEKEKGKPECCNNKQFVLKVEQDKVLNVQSAFNFLQPFVSWVSSVVTIQEKAELRTNLISFEERHPPPQKQPLWLLHCTYTFYG